MKDSGDIAVVGIPFAAGAATGAILAASAHQIPLSLPLALSVFLTVTPAAAFLLFDNRHGPLVIRSAFIILFFAAGLFCYLNSAVTEGVFPEGGQLTRLARLGGDRLKGTIDRIPYQSAGTGPLVKALVTGDRSGLGKDVVKVFRDSGASHILALSGLHLGIMYMMASSLLKPLGKGPLSLKIKYFLIISVAGAYTLVTGASPSIVRAFLFILIGETAKLTGRERVPFRVFAAALTIQLALTPEVITSLGFQLSYLAMAGIVLLYPCLESIYPEVRGPDPFRYIWKAAVLSVSCQIFTAPLVWFRFHTFPKYFLMTNLLALPLTSAVVVLSAATIALSSIGICPGILITLNDRVAGLLVRCLETISSM